MGEGDSVYIRHANIVVGSCLKNDRPTAVRLLVVSGMRATDLPSRQYWRLYDALVLLLKDDKPLIPLMVHTIMPELPLAWLESLVVSVPMQESLASVEVVIGYGDRQLMSMVLQGSLSDLANPSTDSNALRMDMMEKLAGSRRSERTAAGIGDIFQSYADDDLDGMVCSTNMRWFDFLFDGGFRPRQHFAIAAPEKSRKTSLARNLVLRAARSGDMSSAAKNISILFAAFENDRFITAYDFAAMLAMEYLTSHAAGVINARVGKLYTHEYCAVDKMRQYHKGAPPSFPAELRLAYQYAFDQVSMLNNTLYVYDQSREGGDLRSLNALKDCIVEHNVLRRKEDQTLLICVDYLGLVEVPGKNRYEAQSEITQSLQADSVDKGACVMSLAQYTRSATKDRNRNGDDGIIPVDSNPDLARAVQHFFQTGVHPDNDEVLDVEMIVARRKPGKMKQMYVIHPPSGYIVEEVKGFSMTQRYLRTEHW